MLTESQLNEIGPRLEEVLQISLANPNTVLHRLLEMASQEIYQQIQQRTANDRKAA